MSKKNKRKSNSSRNKEDPSNVHLVSEDEWLTREHRQLQRIQDVKVCLGFIGDSVDDYNQLLRQQSKSEHWARFLACDGLPRVQHPPEMRTFIAEIRHFEHKDVQSEVNWALSVDERSPLSQDIYAKDLTRKTLEQNLRPNIGQIYDKYVQRILITIERIELLMDTDFEMAEVPGDRAIEISNIHDELNLEIDLLFDKLSYRIICSPSSYKTSFDGIMECYCYKSPNYNFQLWWLKDVPIRFEYMEMPLMLATLDCVGVQVQIPMSVLCDNLTLRCVHTFFDPYSETAKSYEQVIDKSTNDLNAGMMDIEDCLINEWLMQVTIMHQMITTMEQRLLRYEDNKRDVEGKIAMLPRAEQAEHVKKNLKLPKEPQKIAEGMFPDPYKNFLEQEQQEFIEFLDEFMNPAKLKLEPNEVNLRQYKILGGIYSMVFLRKPKHTDFEKFNITLHEDGRVLYTMQDVRAVLEMDGEDSTYGSRLFSVSSRYKSVTPRQTRMDTRQQQLQIIEPQDVNLHLGEDELPYFYVKFDLPAHLCRFGEPMACQFLEEEIAEEENDEILMDEYEEQPKKKKQKRTPSPKAKKLKAEKVKGKTTSKSSALAKNPIIEVDNRPELPRPRQTIIVVKRETPRNIYRSSVLAMLRLSSLRTTILPGVPLINFEVTGKALGSMQMHNVQKHCIPRILSSFKFPVEFRAERMEKNEEAAEKARGNLLIRRHHEEVHVADDEPDVFSYSQQEGPERVYPVFDWREKVLYEQDESDEDRASGSDVTIKVVHIDQIGQADKPAQTNELSIYGVLHTLEDIQGKYKAHPKKLLNQPNFLSKYKQSITDDDAFHGRAKSSVRVSIGGRFTAIPKSSRTSHLAFQAQSRAPTMERLPEMEVLDSDTCSVASGIYDIKQLRKGSTKEFDFQNQDPHKERPKVKHWTTKYIQHTDFNRETATCTIKTDRLGQFGFAYKRYMHFPFRDWSLQVSETDPNEIIFILDTFYVRVFLFITNMGIRGYVTNITTEYVARPIKYLEIDEPISDYRELRKLFCDKNINIFAEQDACYYIENGYFSEKHVAAELHVYDAFAVHCKLIKFYRSDWNRLATRRNILLCLRNPKDLNDGADVTVRVTPDSSTFVEVTELCSDDLDIFKLDYRPTWRNIGLYSDLHQLINSMYPQATDVRNRDPKLIHYLRTLFTEVRPLSFS